MMSSLKNKATEKNENLNGQFINRNGKYNFCIDNMSMKSLENGVYYKRLIVNKPYYDSKLYSN